MLPPFLPRQYKVTYVSLLAILQALGNLVAQYHHSVRMSQQWHLAARYVAWHINLVTTKNSFIHALCCKITIH